MSAKALFNPAAFGAMSREKPELFDRIDAANPSDLEKVFGRGWKKTPVKDVWYIGVDGCQFTIRALSDQWDIAHYTEDTVVEFRDLFLKQTIDCLYFQIDKDLGQTGSAIVQYLDAREPNWRTWAERKS